jgi:hypothetical protein
MFAVSYLRSVKLFMLTAVAVVLCNAIANGIVAEAQETSEYHWKLSAVRPLRCDRLDQFQTFDREAAQRQGRPRRFLDLFVYQLLALRTLCSCMGGQVQGQRSGGDWSSHAGV